jgi:hypothetical protein
VPSFEKVTAVSGGDGGIYTAEIDPLWTIAGRPNGGYLMAIMARAAIASDAGDDAAHPHPLSASALFVSSPESGPAQIALETLRRGRTASQLRARLSQDGRVRVETLITLGRLGDEPESFNSTTVPDVAPLDQCRLGLAEAGRSGVRMEILSQVEEHLDRRSLHDPAFAGDVRGWLALLDDEPFDPVSLLYAVDALPPATIQLGSTAWVPTLELTAYLRAVPAPGRLRIRQRAGMLAGGIVDQVCEVWDSRGRLVAQATQIAAVRLP